MPNIELEPLHAPSTFRRLALGTWRTPADPSVYGSLTLSVDAALEYIAAYRAATGRHLTITHLIGRAVAAALERVPDANAMIRLGRLYRRRRIAVFFQVAVTDPATGEVDLSGATIHDPQRKSLAEVCDELEARFSAVKQHRDRELGAVQGLLARMPQLAMPALLKLTSLVAYTLNVDLRCAGIPSDAFGSVMVTNIGSLGLDEAYVPLVPYSRVPMLVAVGAIRETPVVRAGRVGVERTLKLCATFDHRVLDGAHAAQLARVVREWIEEPRGHYEEIPAIAVHDEAG